MKLLKQFNALSLMIFYPPAIIFIITLLPLLFFFINIPGMRNLSFNMELNKLLIIYSIGCSLSFYISFKLSSKLKGVINFNSLLKYNNIRTISYHNFERIVLTLTILGIIVLVLIILSSEGDKITKAIISGRSDANTRMSVLENREIPGYVRMFSALIPSAFILCTTLYWLFPGIHKKMRFLFLWVFVGLFMLIRSLYFMDRAPLLSAAILIIYIIPQNIQNKYRKIYIFSIALIFILFTISSSYLGFLRKHEDSNIIVIFEYADLGIANANIAISTNTNYTFGFSTILKPIDFIITKLNLFPDALPRANNAWIHNPGGNLLQMSYLDFGIFGFVIYILLGLISGYLYRMLYKNINNLLSGWIYLWMLIGLLSSFAVPMFRGIEYWHSILINLILFAIIKVQVVQKGK